MLTPEEFPYIKSIHVNDCYTYQNFDINLFDYPDKPFSHLILTGKNGSGKSTILNHLDNYYNAWRKVDYSYPFTNSHNLRSHIGILKSFVSSKDKNSDQYRSNISAWRNELSKYENIIPHLIKNESIIFQNNKRNFIYSFFSAKRVSIVDNVDVPTKGIEFADKLTEPDSTDFFIRKFKQYLVNKKVEQAFNQIDNNVEAVKITETFFNDLTETFQRIFDDNNLSIEFKRNEYEFIIKISGDRELTFNLLSEGFSAFISILMDLFIRLDLIKNQVNDYTYNPCGIVLIDEPETHLHLELQYQILPLLTELFPNIQFIAATHSPAVISSIKHATIFDLTTKEAKNDEVAGRSYSDLMMTHFGLDNEYSNIADEIIKEVNTVLNNRSLNPAIRHTELQKIYDDSSKFLSPTLKIELELLLAKYQSNISAAE